MAFEPYGDDPVFDDKKYLDYSACQLIEDDEDELEDLEGISDREYIREEFAEYSHFEMSRRKEDDYWNTGIFSKIRDVEGKYKDDFKIDMIDDYSLWEDNFGSSKVDLKCTDYSSNFTINEEEFWDAKKVKHRENI